MKKFYKKIICLIFLSISLLVIYNFAAQKIKKNSVESKFKSVPVEIMISNFGSSHGLYGYDYSGYKNIKNCFNFSLTSQMPSYDYRILKQFENHFADGGVMFITVSNFSFGMDEVNMPDFQSKNERYYYFLEPKNIKKCSKLTYIEHQLFPIIFRDPFKMIASYVKIKPKVEEKQNMKDCDYAEDASKAYKRHIFVNSDGSLIVLKDELDSIYGIIAICKEHNIRPILITTPFRKEYNDKFNQSFYSQFHEVVNKICKDTDCEYYDYSHDKRFTNSGKYMRNADHLSECGAKEFTKILMSEVVKSKN